MSKLFVSISCNDVKFGVISTYKANILSAFCFICTHVSKQYIFNQEHQRFSCVFSGLEVISFNTLLYYGPGHHGIDLFVVSTYSVSTCSTSRRLRLTTFWSAVFARLCPGEGECIIGDFASLSIKQMCGFFQLRSSSNIPSVIRYVSPLNMSTESIRKSCAVRIFAITVIPVPALFSSITIVVP